MTYLKTIQSTLQKLILSISKSINFEVAIFDNECNLVTCTETYLKHKGSTVHIPSLQEVLSYGDVLVNKPGYMKSCMGCRFKEDCPATIEILNCIKLSNEPIGIIALTSFNEEGHKRLSENIDIYLDLLKEISDQISIIICNKNYNPHSIELNKILQVVMDTSPDALIITNNKGIVTHYNPTAFNYFSFCKHYEKSIHQILPKVIVEDILTGKNVAAGYNPHKNLHCIITSIAIKDNEKLSSTIIKIQKKNPLTISNKTNLIAPITSDLFKGNNKSIKIIKKQVQKLKHSNSSILITGETGTGKEILAKTIHAHSSRAHAPFIPINCAGIPETLFESELFGYEEGAFTGAKKGGKLGRFEFAHGGTLFLDEIGEMPLFMQSKLLRVLQEHTIERVGSTRSLSIDIRIIAATNQNLEEMVANKKFREDLFYRLNVIPFHIPPLRNRIDDIEILSKEFLHKYNIQLHKNISTFSKETLSVFHIYEWPGNVRELENTVEYAVNMTENDFISVDNLPQRILNNIPTSDISKIKKKIRNIEFDTIKATLDKYGWDVHGKTKAAKELGIGLRTLYRKIKSFEK
ncbi:sigma 54-interacting transcriptional regulator [Lutibacter sp. B2]|nr:sigma 54-interacting transcriptional regulator [Lutibacter sp. B2]